MITPIVGDGLFKVFGKAALLKRLKSERFRLDISNTEKRTKLVDGLVERIQWCIEEKENFLFSFHSSLRHLKLEFGCLEKLESLQKSDTPVLILWGTEDQSVPFNKRSLVMDRLPKAKLVPIEKASHVCIFDEPKKCHETVIEWLQERST